MLISSCAAIYAQEHLKYSPRQQQNHKRLNTVKKIATFVPIPVLLFGSSTKFTAVLCNHYIIILQISHQHIEVNNFYLID